ncbi:beta-galactosidase [Gracilinema caldarium]|uniref:Beta-galactosidase n=1 Tax=Gracilinema caldarium (strain ATCC 51460 / DSM 7334 / H1) TaxID=744872 RepID=F8EWQ4_GRAC1|nr:beta-galactosidase [Gracilinema caldarium]AEJ18217.1 Beta-galactosidase [Gracilinema caldarium DSM 7334]
MSHNLLWGVDWYPEQWDKTLWESDVQRMAEQGFQVVRMMEFAWPILEPRPGNYDFSLFDSVIDILEKYKLTVVLGTPTAIMPVWLVDQDPTILAVHPNRLTRDFGCRRMGCMNAPVYQKAARQLVQAIADHYGPRQSIIGWQIDNEIGHEGSDHCVCDHCRAAWHRWLEKRYETIEELNRRWGTIFWGSTYTRFDQIPLPRQQVATNHNPALLLDYDRFSSDTAVSWAEAQVQIIRQKARAHQFITTNLYPAPLAQCIDMEDMVRIMDAAGWDNYPVWGNQDEPLPYFFTSYVLSYVRGLHPSGNFKVMEEFSGIQGHTQLGHLPPPEQVALWTNQAIARGANAIFYFRWRTAPYAQEQLCYGIRDTDNTETERERHIITNMQNLSPVLKTFASEPVPAEACLVYDRDTSRLIREQPLSLGMDRRPTSYMQVGYDAELARWFAPYVLYNVNCDIKSTKSVNLDNYKLISLPFYQITDEAFVQKLSDWVARGGHLVLGWRSGSRTTDNWNIDRPLPGLFRELAGIRVTNFEALGTGSTGICLKDTLIHQFISKIITCKGEVWADILEPETATIIARYRDSKKHYTGKPAFTRNKYGQGFVWYLGTSPDPKTTFFLYKSILKQAGLAGRFLGLGIEAVQRITQEGKTVMVLLNHTSKKKRVLGKIIPPWGTLVIDSI